MSLSENVSLSGCDNVVGGKLLPVSVGKLCIWEAAHCLIQSFSGDPIVDVTGRDC